MSVNYSKWENLARETDAEEAAAQERERAERRRRHLVDEEARRRKWDQTHPGTGTGTGPEAHRSCGCGYMDPEQIKQLKDRPEVEEVPIAEKNKKKINAILAAKEHGGILFKEGDYNQALAVYERGLLILNGTYDLDEVQQNQVIELEKFLYLNLAAVTLKLKEFKKAP